MPSKTKKPYKKKAYKKKHFQVTKGAPRQIVFYDNNRLNPYPARYITKIHSSVYGGIASGLSQGSFAINVLSRIPFSGSFLLAPVLPAIATLTGAGFRNLCNDTFYRYYRVTGFKLTVEYIPQNTSDTVLCAITPSTSNVTPVSTQLALSQPYTKKGNFSSNKNNTNSKRGNAITLSMKTHQFFGVNKLVFDNDMTGNFSAQWSSVPLRPVYVVGNWQTLDQVATVAAVEYRIDLTQYIEFFENDNATLLTQSNVNPPL